MLLELRQSVYLDLVQRMGLMTARQRMTPPLNLPPEMALTSVNDPEDEGVKIYRDADEELTF